MLRSGDRRGFAGRTTTVLRRMAAGLWLAAVLSTAANAVEFSLLATAGYFQPRDQVFKDIYGNGLAIGAQADMGVWKGLCLWAGVSQISREGELTLTQEKTEIKIIPIFGGLKYRILKTSLSPYVALGVGYFKYQEKNPLGQIDEGDIGYVAQVGVSLRTPGWLSFEAYARYSSCRIKPGDFEANLGGLELGAGFGFAL